MNAKQAQIKHWENCSIKCPYKTTLEMFWNRAGIRVGGKGFVYDETE
jgi:hypothetical protein